MPPNGKDELSAAVLSSFERVAAALSRLNTAIRSMSETILQQADRSEQRAEKLLERFADTQADIIDKIGNLDRSIAVLAVKLDEARDDVRDITDPRIPLLHPSEVQHEKDGALVAFAKLAEKVPTPWVAWLLKLSLPAGIGAALMRALQWLASGH